MRRLLLVCLLLATPAVAQTTWPGQAEQDTILKNVTFDSGETLPEVSCTPSPSAPQCAVPRGK